MYSSDPQERLILWDTEPTSNPPAGHYFVWMKDGELNWRDSDGNDKSSADNADLSGGEDADFDEMPQVDGVPIVESGSNSDGEWVAWADGTYMAWNNGNIEYGDLKTLFGASASGDDSWGSNLLYGGNPPQPIAGTIKHLTASGQRHGGTWTHMFASRPNETLFIDTGTGNGTAIRFSWKTVGEWT